MLIVAWNVPTDRRSFCEVFVASSSSHRVEFDGQRFVAATECSRVEETDKGSARQIFLQGEATRWAIHRVENDLLAWIHDQPEANSVPSPTLSSGLLGLMRFTVYGSVVGFERRSTIYRMRLSVRISRKSCDS